MNISVWINQCDLPQLSVLNKLSDFSEYKDKIDIWFLRCSTRMVNVEIELDRFNRLIQSEILLIKEPI